MIVGKFVGTRNKFARGRVQKTVCNNLVEWTLVIAQPPQASYNIGEVLASFGLSSPRIPSLMNSPTSHVIPYFKTT